MKKILILCAISISGIGFSQINVITSDDFTTLSEQSSPFLDASSSYDPEVSNSNNVGKGLVFPQVDLTKFKFNINDPVPGAILPTYYDGMVVYNTGDGELGSKGVAYDQATMGEKVTVEPGFYYFSNPNGRTDLNVDGGRWVKFADINPDTKTKFWTLKGNADITQPILNDTFTITNADVANFIGTTDASNVVLATNSVARLEIGEKTEQTVGAKDDFKFVLDVYGKARFRDGIVTKASTYPDYVFDNYFTGTSDVNPNYEFKKLNEVEKFIKENNHLPGVTSIKELTKSENGYSVDNTQLSIQTLEKVEELYLHVIEQQKEIQALKAEIAELKK